MQLNFKVNYSLNLFYLTDSASRWDLYVNKNFKSFLERECILNTEAEQALQQYADYRRFHHIGWDSQGELIEWAYAGFSQHTTYSHLLSYIHQVEQIVFKSGQSLKDFLNQAVQNLDDTRETIKQAYGQLHYRELSLEDVVTRLALMNSEMSNLRQFVDCCLVLYPGFGEMSAGANGGVIVAEVDTKMPDPEDTAKVIFHEYVHIATSVHDKFERSLRLPSEVQTAPGMPIVHAGLFEELFVYATCHLLWPDVDPQVKVEQYSQMSDASENLDLVFIWKHVKEFGNVVEHFVDGKIDQDEVWSLLIQKYATWFDLKKYIAKS